MLINAVPQWQGAIGPRARGLVEGCLALSELAGHVLGLPVHHIHQEPGTSELLSGVANRAVLTGTNRAAQLAALEAPGGPVLTIGGDCGVELVPIGVARYRYGPGLGVAWFDAHADLNTAASSPSGAFHGMVLRSLLGEGDEEFAASPAVEAGRVALFGTRAFDADEEAAIGRGLAVRTENPAAALRESGAEQVYLHLDLDVLDPLAFDGANYPEPGGLTISELVRAIEALSEVDVIGAGITECVGTDLEVLEPVIAAVGRVLLQD
ncbi:arginase family protein [Amycolatopsis rhabdoformis]|uniref:Arginase family protein n=1 Tax=Amycolatopsis rhabdoformis TaxID=1448059 RepID=A0ABZ1I736_9PSEU|nr:arginase family protein [Amycolatopsis rhabdoformis]WSE30239.1 arginase family protein [Amycolatopsis rhabdoformis]